MFNDIELFAKGVVEMVVFHSVSEKLRCYSVLRNQDKRNQNELQRLSIPYI